MKKWILAAAILAMAPAATTYAHGFELSIGFGGIHFGGGGYHHYDACGPRFIGPTVYVDPAVTYCAPPVAVQQPVVVYQAPVEYAAPPVCAAPVYTAPPVYVAPPVVYVAPRVYGYPAGYRCAPAGYYYGR